MRRHLGICKSVFCNLQARTIAASRALNVQYRAHGCVFLFVSFWYGLITITAFVIIWRMLKI